MPTTARPERKLPIAAQNGDTELRVSAFENVTGIILALLIVIGAAVVMLFSVWISSRVFAVQQAAVPVVLEDVGGGGREDGFFGEHLELDAPDADVISREADLPQPEVAKTLQMVDAAVGRVSAGLEDPIITEEMSFSTGKSEGDSRRPGRGSGGGTGNGQGPGSGDGVGSGPGGIPRHKRWEIYFQEGETLEGYASQLDFFGIELGVVGGQNVDYARRLSQGSPEKYTGPSEQEQRLYMSWRQGALKQADTNLLRRAGIDPTNKIALQFYPPAIENQLAQLEVAFANRHPSQIRKTRFGVRGEPGSYEFYVIDQAPL